ncbi:MAG TPA: ATP-grasp domain-containing protein [Methylophilaceae bacterium]|nr:ATP-grasp domain-containing protein [Methylophilaceae bacterium]
MPIAYKPSIIIAALSSRIYVEAAVKAGYDVIAIDAFIDRDVEKLARKSFQIDLIDNQLESCRLIEILNGLNLKRVIGFCYGAGFEKQTHLLREVNKRLLVLGNLATVIDNCKIPKRFFGTCKELDIPFPEVTYQRPMEGNDWVAKRIGGSGGGHIKPLIDIAKSHDVNIYYQKQQQGVSISCLFLASKYGVDVIGINEQWVNGSFIEPYRYGGAVSHADVSKKVKKRLICYLSSLSDALGLIGINSCDAIYNGDDVYVLEINPRLSASMDLYPNANLMEMHIAACQNSLEARDMGSSSGAVMSRAHQIVYAGQALKLKNNIIWPEWVRDVPAVGACLKEGAPICTILAEAETASLAKELLADRVSTLARNFLN